jgi:hypothetical protein
MKPMKLGGIGLLAVCMSLSTSATADAQCQTVQGKLTEIVADPFLSPSDPLGRVVNYTTGSLKSTGTAILTSIGPGPQPGTLSGTTRHLFVVNETDQLIATGVHVWTPIAGTTDVTDVLTLTVQGGTGAYSGATGQIVATGIGFNFFPLPPGPTAGSSYFVFKFEGEICPAP